MSYANQESKRTYWKKHMKTKRTREDWGREYTDSEIKTKQFIKRQLVNSNGAICALCGKPILNMKDCTIDHIRPISKGGLTTKDNCRLAHSWCNRIRGNNQEFDQQCGQ